jgi:type IV pilus assembly protein PilE
MKPRYLLDQPPGDQAVKKNSGFTLIELMIALVIVGILSAIAFNTYSSSVLKSNRTEARSALQTAAATLEKCRSVYGVFNHANCGYADFDTETDLYSISGAITASTFVLTALPKPGGLQVGDAKCTSLTLGHTGIKGGTGTDSAECW